MRIRLAREWKLRLAGRQTFTESEARFFHRQYVAALDMDGLVTQAIVAVLRPEVPVALKVAILSGLAKNQPGVTIFGWRDEKRMLEAAQLLRGTDISVAEIGQLIGIPDPAYFSRIFLRHVGTGPRAYRQGLPMSLDVGG